MNRYRGNTGAVTKYRAQPQIQQTKPAPFSPQCAKREQPSKKDIGDIWVLAVFFLLYMESRDTDFLIILGVLAFYMFL